MQRSFSIFVRINLEFVAREKERGSARDALYNTRENGNSEKLRIHYRAGISIARALGRSDYRAGPEQRNLWMIGRFSFFYKSIFIRRRAKVALKIH